MPRRRLTVLAALAAAATVLTLADTSHAQTGRQWVSLDQSPPGTPADVVIDRQRSDGTQSFFDIFVHGFFATPRMGPDQNLYYDLEVPGMGTLNQLGAPNLPAVQIPLALPMGVQGASLIESTPVDVASFDDAGLVWPQTKPEIDGAPNGTPEEFVRDDAIYRLQTPWPPDDGGVDGPARPMLGPIMGAMLELHPFRWTPATRRLDVIRHWQLLIKHEGDPQSLPEPITRDRGRLAARHFENWPTVSPFFDINVLFYAGDFLVIREAKYDDELAAFVSQKWARGFSVTEVDIEATGNTCNSIRTIIQDWYASTPAHRDHYCLLVGDVQVIPLCTSPGGDPTDDLYASPIGNDLAEEVYLGRLSVDSETDLTQQVAKILAYENHGVILGNYDEALLVAHREGAPGKYVGAHESVRTAVYSDPPTFTTLYGNAAGVSNAAVTAQINAGLGLVAYRGHGDTYEWWEWDLADQSYLNADVNALANGSMTPVVWSFACTNHNLAASDCMGEAWLEKYPGGAVSSYGATVPSGTEQNHELDRRMFKAVYHLGLKTQSHAIEYAEAQMAALVAGQNSWMYNLLGDPDMQIRTKGETPWIVVKDPVIKPCQGPGCFVKLRILDLQGQPIPGIQVGVYKPGAPGGPGGELAGGPEVFDNRYTDPEGIADIPAAPATDGFLYFTVQDESGNSVLDSIPVRSTTDAPAPAPARLQLAAHPTVARAGTFFAFGAPLAAPATVTVFDVSGRAVRVLEARSGAAGVRWEGDDENGRRVGPGVYHARLEAAGVRLMTRVVVLW